MSQKRGTDSAGRPGLFTQLYDLLSDTTFAILVLIALAVASIVGLVIIDQIPFRGEMARAHFADRTGEPLIWTLIHIVPASPFRSVLYRTILALLSLSLLACTIKRWRGAWRQAFSIGWQRPEVFDRGALIWNTRVASADASIVAFLKRHLFVVRTREEEGGLSVAASRGGAARIGPVLTHLGLLLLVIGSLWLSSSGTSRMLWMRAGDDAALPEIGARLHLEDFRIETTPQGKVSGYISEVGLYADEGLVRRSTIKVNHPLRYRGRSFYQSSYREDPGRVKSVDLLYDAGASSPHGDAGEPAGMPHHAQVPARFAQPITVTLHWGERVLLTPTSYEAVIDTFLADFRIDARGPISASDEPHNPAVHIRFFENGAPAGETWYFLHHPDMPVGSGPKLSLRFTGYVPQLTTGLEVSTHPGSIWIWAGFAVMTLGTLLAFLLRHERVWARLRRTAEGWEVAWLHQGAPKRAPEYIRAPWEAATTTLGVDLVRRLEPEGGAPVRWRGLQTREGDEA